LHLQGSAKAIGLSTGLDDVRSVRDSIQQCLAQARIGKHLLPLGKRQVRSHDQRGSLGAFGDHLEQELGPDVGFAAWSASETGSQRSWPEVGFEEISLNGLQAGLWMAFGSLTSDATGT
jgi:hypothetical protein